MSKYTVVILPVPEGSGQEEVTQGAYSFDVRTALGKPELKGQLEIVLFTSSVEALVMLQASGLKDRGDWMVEFDPEQVQEEEEYDHIEGILRTTQFVIVDLPFPRPTL